MTEIEFHQLGLHNLGCLDMLKERVEMYINIPYGIKYELHRRRDKNGGQYSFYHYGYKGKVYKNEKELLKVLKDVPFDPKHSVWNQQ